MTQLTVTEGACDSAAVKLCKKIYKCSCFFASHQSHKSFPARNNHVSSLPSYDTIDLTTFRLTRDREFQLWKVSNHSRATVTRHSKKHCSYWIIQDAECYNMKSLVYFMNVCHFKLSIQSRPRYLKKHNSGSSLSLKAFNPRNKYVIN